MNYFHRDGGMPLCPSPRIRYWVTYSTVKLKLCTTRSIFPNPTQMIPSHSIYPKHEIQYMLINSQNKVSCSVRSEYVKQDINNSTAESVELSHQTLAAQSESHSQTVRQPAQCFIVLSPVHTHEAAGSFPYTSLIHHGRQTRYVLQTILITMLV